jgi:mono/diheme cytochrome c family protein
MRREGWIVRKIGALMLSGVCAVSIGCSRIPGRPGPGPEVGRPEALLSFPALYKENCAACHGENGKNGAAISLANPVYLAVAGEANLERVTAMGVRGTLMPPFAKSAGGTLTDQQVGVIAQGLLQWGRADLLAGQSVPPYASALSGDVGRGQLAYAAFCARCHGASGEGIAGDSKTGAGKVGSIVNSSYLALISDQGLRSIVIAGRPEDGMPDWRSDGTQPLSDQQITDIVAWLASKRIANPGQPYR